MSRAPRPPRVPAALLAVVLIAGVLGLGYAIYLVSDDDRTEQAQSGSDSPFRGNRLPEQLTTRTAPRIRLHDSDGLLMDTRELRGRAYVVTFLFTACPDVCPLIGQQVKQGLELLGPRGREVTALFVSVDPRGDTPEAVERWLERQRMPGNIRYLVGDRDQLEPVWASYYAAPQDPARPETSTHSAAVWLIDEEGRRRTKHDAGDGIDPADLAADVELLLSGRA